MKIFITDINTFIKVRLSIVLFIFSNSLFVYSQSTVQQYGENPIVINQTESIDNLVMLNAARAERLSTMTVEGGPSPKHGYVTNFKAQNDYITWHIRVPSNATYNAKVLLNPGDYDQSYELIVDDNESFPFSVDDDEWTRAEVGAIYLSTGNHELTLKRNSTSGTTQVKSIELLRQDLQASYDNRLDAFKVASAQSTADFSEMPWGIMFQYGPWGYALDGSQKSVDEQAADFDVPAFVEMIKSTNAHYVIWSISWWTYEFSAPIQAVDDIVGNGNRTSSRDLIGDIAQALDDEGIDFYMYYHTGQDSHLGYNSTDFWREQDFPSSSFRDRGYGDRSVFFNNWVNVITEVGNRYGDLLKGWFFDDGRTYYPAPFEELATAARAGNSSRLLSYNNASQANITDFSDIAFGESCGSANADIGSDGQYIRGNEIGLSGHCMYKLDDAWGVAGPDYTTTTNYSIEGAYRIIQENSSRGVPTSFDIMMWEDGTVWQPTLDVLKGLGEIVSTVCPNAAIDFREAECYDNMFGIQTEPSTEGTPNVGWIEDGDWTSYDDMDLSRMNSIEVRVACNFEGGIIEVRLGSITGQVIGTLTISNTGGNQEWGTIGTNIEAVTGNHDIYLVFKGGNGYLFNINYFGFSEDTVLSKDENEIKTVNIFPNPVNNELTIKLHDNYDEKTSIKLYAVNGQKIIDAKPSNEVNLDLSKLSRGVYILIVKNKSKNITKKIVKL